MRALIASAENEGARLQFWARNGALAAIALVIIIVFKWDAQMLYVLSALTIFFLTGLISYRLAIAGRRKMPVGLILGIIDIALLTFLMVAPSPFAQFESPPAMALREGGFKYVDKTARIHRLISNGASAFFLSRPRRFGKSLLCSTLGAVFESRRKL